jgi:hypothetical protein
MEMTHAKFEHKTGAKSDWGDNSKEDDYKKVLKQHTVIVGETFLQYCHTDLTAPAGRYHK